MIFTKETIDEAWKRSGGFCECRRRSHIHHIHLACKNRLIWEHRDKEQLIGGWSIYKKISDGQDETSNCQVLCRACYDLTTSYEKGRINKRN